MSEIEYDEPTPADGAEDGFVKVGEVEVGGVVVDRDGRKWQVPAANVEDLDDLYGTNFAVPDPDPVMHYQTVRIENVPAARRRGFDVVSQEELGISRSDQIEYGQPTGSAHAVGDSILMKCPKIIHERIQAAKDRRAKEAVNSMEPSQQAMDKARASDFPTMLDRDRSIGSFTGDGEKIVEETIKDG